MFTLTSLSLFRGGRTLLDHVDLTVHPGERIGLVGANGSGKTTLLAILRGELAADSGDVQRPNGQRLAHAAQEIEAASRPAIEIVLDGDPELRRLEAELARAQADNDGAAIARVHAGLDAIDYWTARTRATRLLVGLGFPPGSEERPANTFSGGWRIRLNLAQALFTPSDLLLLDEPTNHLDLDALLWLEQTLRQYRGTLVVISHDREFLDGVCTHIVHIDQGKLYKYTGDYSDFMRQRAERRAQQAAQFQKQEQQRADLQRFVDRFRAKASKAKQAQSRMKALEKLNLDAPIDDQSAIRFQFPQADKQPNPVSTFDQVQLGYDEHVVLRNVKLTLNAGDRIGLLGRNGAGKSTFIKFLAGELAAQSGERSDGQGVRIGYFAQHTLEQLDMNASALTHLRRLDPQTPESSLRSFLGQFGFSGDRATSAVGPFSGGEKARIALAMIVWQKPNLLLLDEPTNHLDLDLRNSLTEALQSFEGALVLVSHDRHLLRATCDQLLLVSDGKVAPFDGDLEDYRDWLFRSESAIDRKADDGTPSGAQQKKDRKRIEAQHRQIRAPLTQKIKTLETRMSTLQGKLDTLAAQLADAAIYEASEKDRLKKALAEQTELKRELDQVEGDWYSASEELETLSQAQAQELEGSV